jgi:hypothetical protein
VPHNLAVRRSLHTNETIGRSVWDWLHNGDLQRRLADLVFIFRCLPSQFCPFTGLPYRIRSPFSGFRCSEFPRGSFRKEEDVGGSRPKLKNFDHPSKLRLISLDPPGIGMVSHRRHSAHMAIETLYTDECRPSKKKCKAPRLNAIKSTSCLLGNIRFRGMHDQQRYRIAISQSLPHFMAIRLDGLKATALQQLFDSQGWLLNQDGGLTCLTCLANAAIELR